MDSTPLKSVPNGKYRHIAVSFLPHIPLLLLGLGILYRGYWLLLPALFLLVVVPLLDTLTGWQDDVAFEKNDFSRFDIFLFNWNTRLYAILYLAAVICVVKLTQRLTPLETTFASLSLSLLGGIAFAAAHELLHGKEAIDQILQRILTTVLFYPHYKLIHIQSHHAHAATDHDKNTAWLNENIYRYILRTIPQSMFRCWQMEAARRTGVFRNRMFAFAIAQIAFLAGLYFFAGLQGLLFYVGQVIGAHVVLESVNYIQHYGLMREQHEGEYEKTGAEHSWDTYHYFSSHATFRVGHHSYHHISVKPYYLLSPEPEAPKLPVGYFWAIPMVFLPFFWRRVINPRLASASSLPNPA
jgi:alkane 1-monooxygenase